MSQKPSCSHGYPWGKCFLCIKNAEQGEVLYTAQVTGGGTGSVYGQSGNSMAHCKHGISGSCWSCLYENYSGRLSNQTYAGKCSHGIEYSAVCMDCIELTTGAISGVDTVKANEIKEELVSVLSELKEIAWETSSELYQRLLIIEDKLNESKNKSTDAPLF